MAQRVFLHIGAPKTGTTYIQTVLRDNRDRLRRQGILIPRGRQKEFAWASNVVRETPNRPFEAARTAWKRMVDEVQAFDGSAIISHEFLAAATQEQASRAIADLAVGETHLVYTARDYVQQVPAIWQERLKFRMTTPLTQFEPEPLTARKGTPFGWRSLDVVDALKRWSHDVPPERVHVVTVPPRGSPRELLWHRFAAVCGIDPERCETGDVFANQSLGAVECELLRRINPKLSEVIAGPAEVPRWVRDYLANSVLAPRDGDAFGLPVQRAEELRARSLRTVEELKHAGYHIVGDLEELVAPVALETVRRPEDTTDAELLDAAMDVIARMLLDHRHLILDQERLRRNIRRLKRAHKAAEHPFPHPHHTYLGHSLLRRALRGLRRQ